MNSEKKEDNIQNNIKKTDIKEKNIDSIDLIQNEKINDLKIKLLKNEKKIHDIELRKLANIENIKKNTAEKIKTIKNIKTETFLTKVIPIIDYLEDILLFSNTLKIKDEALIKGIELTLHSLLNILLKLGVEIKGKENETFNSDIHDIIETKSSENISNKSILSVHRKAFIFNKKILRKATVTISKK